jgi:hypothetical protein
MPTGVILSTKQCLNHNTSFIPVVLLTLELNKLLLKKVIDGIAPRE